VELSSPDATYSGPIAPGNIAGHIPDPYTADAFTDVNYYGSLAVRLTIPVHPIVSLTDILGQILEASWFPELMRLGNFQNVANFVKTLSDDFVNFEFGWEPFKADVESLIKAVTGASKALGQFERDSNNKIRRRHVFDTQQLGMVEDFVGDFVLSSPPQAGNTASQAIHRLTGVNSRYPTNRRAVTSRRIWFSGAYSYYSPVGKSLNDYERRVNSVVGVEITPEVLWDLAPWSWLADWRYNIGTILSNQNALSSDSLVMRYGYLMCETTTQTEITAENVRVLINGIEHDIGPVSAFWTSVRKERFKANPYGFGKDPSDLSTIQWSILIALGLAYTAGSLL